MIKFVLAALTLLFVTSARAEPAYDKSVKICNYASSRIIHVWASHVDRRKYGSDRLSGNIQPGSCRTIDPGPQQGYCMIDFKVQLADGRTAESTLNACEIEVWNIT